MRKENKQRVVTTDVNDVRQQGYHERNGHYDPNGQFYAFLGFNKNLYFRSDRAMELTSRWERPDGKALKGFGLEIELECNYITSAQIFTKVLHELVFDKLPNNLFKYQHDGSLGDASNYYGLGYCVGTEAITQVMTKEFIRNHYPEWRCIYDVAFPSLGISASATGRCGMHVNISNACFGGSYDEPIRKLYYIVNTYFKTMCTLLSRNPEKTRYCKKMDCSIDIAKNLRLSQDFSDHSCCFNLGHYDAGRIELRLVGGQPNFNAFRTTCETIFFLIERVKEISWLDIQDITKVFNGCNQYVLDGLLKAKSNGYLREENYNIIANAMVAADF